MTFNYIIQNEKGLFYNGNAFGDERDWTSEKREGFNGAFHYTENGANTKIGNFPIFFKGCKVVRAESIN